MYFSVIIPVYNEEKRITKTLLNIDSYLKKQPYEYEIIVVNDGSKDKTVQVIKKLKIKNLRIIDNKENHGKGYVVRQGLLNSKGNYRLFTDADNATPIYQLEKFFPYLGEYEIIIGSRSINGAKILKPQPLYRRILGNIYRLLAKTIVGFSDIKDTQCGFKLFSAKCVNDIIPRCIVNGWSFDLEILVIAKELGYKIKEVPISWTNNSDTRVKFKDLTKEIIDLLKIRWNIITGKY